MRRKDQRPLPIFGNDTQKLAEQIYKHTRIQLVNRHCHRRTVVHTNQKMQDRDDFFDAFRLVLQRDGFAVLQRHQLNAASPHAVFLYLRAEFFNLDR